VFDDVELRQDVTLTVDHDPGTGPRAPEERVAADCSDGHEGVLQFLDEIGELAARRKFQWSVAVTVCDRGSV